MWVHDTSLTPPLRQPRGAKPCSARSTLTPDYGKFVCVLSASRCPQLPDRVAIWNQSPTLHKHVSSGQSLKVQPTHPASHKTVRELGVGDLWKLARAIHLRAKFVRFDGIRTVKLGQRKCCSKLRWTLRLVLWHYLSTFSAIHMGVPRFGGGSDFLNIWLQSSGSVRLFSKVKMPV